MAGNIQIRDVWADNLDHEISLIKTIVDKHRYIGMDTEFPGVVFPSENPNNRNVIDFLSLKKNVDTLKLIQLGLTFSDENGNLPTFDGDEHYCVWQFNFKEFNVVEDRSSEASIELLRNSGIDFEKNNEKGIDCSRFAELLMPSGVVLSNDMHWVTFQGAYDFGYLLKILTARCLPETVSKFFDLINKYFPNHYDVKHMMSCKNLHGGLNKLAEDLNVERIGESHQAGSDSLHTVGVFMKLRDTRCNGTAKAYKGVVHGFAT